MTPLEEQLENLARKWEEYGADADNYVDGHSGDAEVLGSKLEARSNAKDLRALLPLEVTDEGVNVPKAALAQVMAIVRLTYPVRPESLAAEAIRQCNAALTQPQTERERFGSRPYTPEQREFMEKVVSERQPLPQPVFPLEDDGGGAAAEKCPNPDCEGGTRPNGEGGWDMCPDCLEAANADGGGAATAAGVADADLEGIEVHINGSSDLSPDEAKILGDAMKRAYVLMKERQGTTAIKPGPYAEAFRERVCPVPEFPTIAPTWETEDT